MTSLDEILKRHSNLHVFDDELLMRNFSLSKIAEEYGTPLYVVDSNLIVERYREMKNAFLSENCNALIAYAYKANSLLAITKLLAKEGAGATVVSAYGIKLALLSGVKSEKIVLVGPSKSYYDLIEAVKNNIGLINIESEQELTEINKIAEKTGNKVNIGIRVNLGLSAGAHPKIRTGGRKHKFGVDEKTAIKLYKYASKMKGIKPIALHAHIGSQITDLKVFQLEAQRLALLASIIYKQYKLDVPVLDLGGGLGIPYTSSGERIPYKEFVKIISKAINEVYENARLQKPMMIVEPGRYLVADSTLLLMKVNYIKRLGRKIWILVDTGMNDFIRTAMYNAYHEIIPVKIRNKKETYNIGGPICESSDVFAINRELPEVKKNDLLALLDAGAYGISMSSTYNIRPRPAAVMLFDNKLYLIRERETFEDIIKHDKTLPDC
ncbi:MAG: diaminopimelate decarboxylase [Thermoprotei archaeon]